jgi:hypothetical protein
MDDVGRLVGRLHIAEGDIRALVGKLKDDRSADAAGTAGDEDALSCKFTHVTLL